MRPTPQHEFDAEETARQIEVRERQKRWYAMSTLEREAEYNRNKPCQHKYEYQPIHSVETDEPWIRECRSYDPYFYTKHTPDHDVDKFFKGQCECNGCIAGVGIERNDGKNKFKLAVQLVFLFVVVAGGR